MKKIIQHGNRYTNNNELLYLFKCNKCGCQFTMTVGDLRSEQQSIVYLTQTKCPECNEFTFNGEYLGIKDNE